MRTEIWRLIANRTSYFHDRLASAAQNRFIVHLFKSIGLAFQKFLAESFAAMPEMIQQSLVGHEAVFKALKNRDTQAAVAAMADHIAVVQRAIETYYRQQDEETE